MRCLALVHGKMKPVKNLGWLLRHHGDVCVFSVRQTEEFEKKYGYNYDTILTAKNDLGKRIFVTEFASRRVLWDWLDRPVFRGIPVSWMDIETECGGADVNGKKIKILMNEESSPEERLTSIMHLRNERQS